MLQRGGHSILACHQGQRESLLRCDGQRGTAHRARSSTLGDASDLEVCSSIIDRGQRRVFATKSFQSCFSECFHDEELLHPSLVTRVRRRLHVSSLFSGTSSTGTSRPCGRSNLSPLVFLESLGGQRRTTADFAMTRNDQLITHRSRSFEPRRRVSCDDEVSPVFYFASSAHRHEKGRSAPSPVLRPPGRVRHATEPGGPHAVAVA